MNLVQISRSLNENLSKFLPSRHYWSALEQQFNQPRESEGFVSLPSDMTSTLTDQTDAPSPGWDAISARLDQLYPGQEPKHFGTLISHMLGGPDPLDGISAWRRTDQVPHWHFVTESA